MSIEKGPHGIENADAERKKAAKAFSDGINKVFARHFDDVVTTRVGKSTSVDTLLLYADTPQGRQQINVSRQTTIGSHMFRDHAMSIQLESADGQVEQPTSHEYSLEGGVVQHREISFEPDISALLASNEPISIAHLEKIMEGESTRQEDNSVPVGEVQRIIELADQAEPAPVTIEALVDDHIRSRQEDEVMPYEAILAHQRFTNAIEELLTEHHEEILIAPTSQGDGMTEAYYSNDEEHHFGMAVGKTTKENGEKVYHVIAVRKGEHTSTTLSFFTEGDQVKSHLSAGEELFSDTVLGIKRIPRLKKFMRNPLTQD